MSNHKTLVAKFSALGDATRYRLFRLLSKSPELCVSQLADAVDITPAGASQQLKVLEQAELITRVRYGQKICYHANVSAQNKQVISLIEKGET